MAKRISDLEGELGGAGGGSASKPSRGRNS
jgi:hypothetical protein